MHAKRIAILGGGITGLSLAYFLQERYGERLSITLLEKSPRLGGLIRSDRVGKHLFERGPHSCRIKSEEEPILKLAKQLNLESEIIWPAPASRQKFLLDRGRLFAMPRSPLGLVLRSYTRPLATAAFKERRIPKGESADESIESFVRRRFSQRVVTRFADPITTGIFAGDVSALSMRSCFPKFFEWERSHGSVIRGLFASKKQSKGKATMFSFKEGIETLPKALASSLSIDSHCSCAVTRLEVSDGSVRIHTDRQTFEADHLFSTLPAHALSPLVEPFSLEASRRLQEIPYASLALVSVVYNQPVLKRSGFGYLIPSIEGETALGVIFDSEVFPEQAADSTHTRLTVMLGGARHEELLDLPDHLIEQQALETLGRHLGIRQKPALVSLFRARDAIPQYLVGHEAKIVRIQELLQKSIPQLTLGGSLLEGPGLADRVLQASELLKALEQTGASGHKADRQTQGQAP